MSHLPVKIIEGTDLYNLYDDLLKLFQRKLKLHLLPGMGTVYITYN